MLFNSIEFLIYLPVVFLLYWFVFNRKIKLQNLFIVIVSYLFYGWWDWRFLILIAFTSFCSWLSGVAIAKVREGNDSLSEDTLSVQKKCRWITGINIFLNLLILGFFKYFNFFVDNFVEAFSLLGITLHKSTLQIILPVGISFYTFQALSYTIDVYRRRLEPTKDIVAFFAFVSFFPQLVAGPIERATNLLVQFYKPRKFTYDYAVDGMRQILWGFFKKMVIADNCALVVNDVFGNYSNYSASTLVLGAFLFAFQIYGDFSGYSDMAIGLGKLFGFDFPENFNYPYLSKSVQEFWRRWHISLGTWFREYLYFPLGGSRKGAVRTYVNLMIVFLVTGLWHGAGMTFVLWGVYYGVLQVIERLGFKKILGKYPVIGWSYTFLAALFGWVLFRADTFAQAGGMMVRMICPWKYLQTDVLLQNIVDHRAFVMLIVGLLGCGFIQKIWQRIPGTKRWKYSIGEAVWCAILGVLSLAALAGNTYNPFIYFRF